MSDCPHCGQPMPTLTEAQRAIKSAVLTPEEDEKIREYVEYLAWKNNQAKRKRTPK